MNWKRPSSNESPSQSSKLSTKLAKDFKEDAVKEQEVEESLAADKSMENKWWK